jgi:hypothetical protein
MGSIFTFFIVITSFRECFNYKHFCYVVKLKCSDILRAKVKRLVSIYGCFRN